MSTFTEGDVRAISVLGFIRGVEVAGIDPLESDKVKGEFAGHRAKLQGNSVEMRKFVDKLSRELGPMARQILGNSL